MPYLPQAFVFLAAVVIAVPLAARAGLGGVLGYLVAGMAIGPHGLGLLGGAGQVIAFAEFGVVLLLFLVGLSLDPRRLAGIRRDALAPGALQVVATAAAFLGLGLALGLPWRVALIAGLGLAISSTAVIVQVLSERREAASRHGRAAFGVSLFQDLAVIPILAVLPALAGRASPGAGPTWIAAARVAAVVAAVVIAARLVARPLLRAIAALRNPDVFTAASLLLVVATALAVSAAGLSMALGAFLAGVLLATSEYRHQLEADLAPFKGLLLGLFFVAVGMSADLRLIAARPALVLALVAALVLVKAAVALAVGLAFLRGRDEALSLALLLSQGSEFGFVLFRLATGEGILSGAEADLLVLAVTLSLATTPALFALHARVVRPWLRRRGPARPFDPPPEGEPPVLIAGFGRVGQVVARVLNAKRIPFTALDASAEHIDFVRRFGNRVFYGDASRLDLLRAAGADRARVLVLALDEVEASIRTAELVRTHFPHLAVLARARNRQHAYRLRRLGIRVVIRETLLSSLELTGEVLEALDVPRDEARRALERFRAHDEALFEASLEHQDDLERLVEITLRGREELERLFEEDARDRRSA